MTTPPVGRLTFATLIATALAASAAEPLVFRDAGDDAGLFPTAGGIMGHGCAWGDGDGDGWIDLYVGTFHYEKSKSNLFFRNEQGKFRHDAQPAMAISARATGMVFADLDNDGDLDLYSANMPSPADSKLAARLGHAMAPCQLLKNDGRGNFTNVSEGNGACPPAFGGRSVALLDYDGDGLLDLLVGEDPLPGYNGSPTKSTRLFHNDGDLKFTDVSRSAGLTEGAPGLGVAAADVNNDGWPDFFLAANGGGNVLFLNDGRGGFREAPGSREAFHWDLPKGDNMVCGVAFGDLNRDGLLDAVLGQHFDSPWVNPVPNRVYLNRGIKDGNPNFEEITEAAGLIPLPLKAPHVEIQDFDNDGWPDIYASLVKFADGRPHPLIFRHRGLKDGQPRFEESTLAVNDFPTAEDKALKRSGALFDKILKDKRVIYTAPGPTGDYDNDGRLDMFLPNWWPESRSLLLHNETKSGNWLDVRIEGTARPGTSGVNRMGIGTRIRIYSAGKFGDPAALLGCQDLSVGFGYASGQTAIAHFGLGDAEAVDVEAILPHNKGKLVQRSAKANQRITLK